MKLSVLIPVYNEEATLGELIRRVLDVDVEKELIVGWNPKAEIILSEYADYLLKGSTINVMCLDPDGLVRSKVEAINDRLDDIHIAMIGLEDVCIDCRIRVVDPPRKEDTLAEVLVTGWRIGEFSIDRGTLIGRDDRFGRLPDFAQAAGRPYFQRATGQQ